MDESVELAGFKTQVIALLANHAETQNGLLFVSGGGIDRVFAPPGSVGPWVVHLGLGIRVNLAWGSLGVDNRLVTRLVDFDSNPVLVPDPESNLVPLTVETTFNVPRNEHMEPGESQSLNFAVNFPGLRLPRKSTYVFVISVNDEELSRVSFRIMDAPVP